MNEMAESIQALQAELAKKDAEIAELRKEKKRLDWLEKWPRLSEINVDGRVEDCYFYGVAGAPCIKLREIIDAHIAAEEQAK